MMNSSSVRSGRGRLARRPCAGQELPVTSLRSMSASDWLRTFAFGLSNVGGCLERSLRVSEAVDRSTLKLDVRQSSSRRHPPAVYVGRPTAAFEGRELELSTLCCPSLRRAGRPQCSGSRHSRPQRELTVSPTFRSSRRQRDRDADDRSQGSADVARRMCVARWSPERQLNRCLGHWTWKTNRMSAAHGAGLTHPTLWGSSRPPKAAVGFTLKPDIDLIGRSQPDVDVSYPTD